MLYFHCGNEMCFVMYLMQLPMVFWCFQKLKRFFFGGGGGEGGYMKKGWGEGGGYIKHYTVSTELV